MQVTDATTPLRQLYFVVQLMLMSPHDIEEAKAVYRQQHAGLLAVAENAEILDGLEQIYNLVESKRYYEALRKVRALFEVEQLILTGGGLPRPVEVA
jgi:flagellar biosynthesis repressor protein FlbT